MSTGKITADQLRNMWIAGANNLAANKELLNSLNVYPVPDGDTGTNMSLTFNAAVKEISSLKDVDHKKISKALSTGALLGARGNSGVILSQIFRGFSFVIEEAADLDSRIFAKALEHASEVAYRAVIKPVEGTILTVAKSVAEAALKAADKGKDVEEMLAYAIQKGNETLDKTPEMLPTLKKAGVVDAGGKGYLIILEGALASLRGEELQYVIPLEQLGKEPLFDDSKLESILYGYCTEFIVRGDDLQREKILSEMESREGDSLVVVVQDDIAKIHFHTNHPGEILEYGLSLGNLQDIKIDNMRKQHEAAGRKERKDYGFLYITNGEGLQKIAEELGADVVLSGGQTMNPSTEDIISGIKEVHAKVVYVLPNNKNIILAASQADHIIEDVEVIVIPTKSFPQGIAAMMAFDDTVSIKDNQQRMTEAIGKVKTGEVTFAVRDTEIDGHKIEKGSIIGLADGTITASGKDLSQVVEELLGKMYGEEDVISIYYGQEVREEEAEGLAGYLEEIYPDLDIEVYYGGQSLYYYIISLE